MKPALLRALLIALLMAVQLATVLIVLFGMRDKATDRFVASAQASVEQFADIVTDKIGDYLAPSRVAAGLTRHLVEDGPLDTRDDQAVVRYFLAQLSAAPTIAAMSVAQADGSFVSVVRSGELFLSRTGRLDGSRLTVRVDEYSAGLKYLRGWDGGPQHVDIRLRPWYRLGLQAPELVWTDAYLREDSASPGITATVRLHDAAGLDVGILAIDIDIQALSDFIARIPAVQNGSAAMVDRHGRVIAFSGSNRLSGNQSPDRLARFEEVAGLALRRFYRLHGQNQSAAGLPSDGSPERYDSDGRAHIGLIRPVSVFGSQPGWKLIAQAPVAGFTAQLTELFEDQILPLVLGIVLPGLLAAGVIMGLTRPLFRLHADATVDRLTGVLNRIEFERRLGAMSRSRRETESGQQLALVILDLDGFKQINDRFGHGAGDSVLKQFAARLKSRLRKDDLIGRLGGDEFLIALRLDSPGAAAEHIEKIRQRSVNEPFRINAGFQQAGATAGIAWLDPGFSPQAAIADADQALVTGKALSKNCSYWISSQGVVTRVAVSGSPGCHDARAASVG